MDFKSGIMLTVSELHRGTTGVSKPALELRHLSRASNIIKAPVALTVVPVLGLTKGRTHVQLNLSLREGVLVDADFIDNSLEPITASPSADIQIHSRIVLRSWNNAAQNSVIQHSIHIDVEC